MVEILIALALIALVMGGAALGVGALEQARLKSAAGRVGAIISYLSHEAVIKGRPMRLAVDLGSNTYRVEMMAEEQDRAAIYLAAAEKRAEGEEEKDEEDKDLGPSRRKGPEVPGLALGIADLFQAPKAVRAKPVWEPLPASLVKVEPLAENVRFAAIYTPQQTEPFTQGVGYVYFWPSGRTEHTLLYLSLADAEESETDKFFSVLVEPLTGRAQIHAGRYELPSDLTEFDNPEEVEEEDDFGL